MICADHHFDLACRSAFWGCASPCVGQRTQIQMVDTVVSSIVLQVTLVPLYTHDRNHRTVSSSGLFAGCSALPSSRREILQGTALASVAGPLSQLFPAHAGETPGNLVPLTGDQTAALRKAMAPRVTKVKAPVLLRQVFHDSGTYNIADSSGGPNASVQFELDRPENRGLKRGWSTVEEVCHLHPARWSCSARLMVIW